MRTIVGVVSTFVLEVEMEVKKQKKEKKAKKRKARGFEFTITDENGKDITDMIPVTVHVDKQIVVAITPIDARPPPQPASVDGDISAETPDGFMQLFPSEGGTKLAIVGLAPTTTPAIIKITADADLGAGVKTITDTIEVTVLAAPPPPIPEAVGFNMVAGPETDV